MLKLSCTAEDMIPLAKACDFKGSRGDGVRIWKEQERAEIRAELDAAYFHLYGLERDDVEYVLSTFTNTGHVPADQRGPDGQRGPDARLGSDGRRWAPGLAGELVIEAFDRLSG